MSRKHKRDTKKHQRNPGAGATFHPRGLFRGLTVPISFKPGQKYLHPERRKPTDSSNLQAT